MKRLLLVIICCCIGARLFAQTDTIQLDNIEISASRSPVLYSETIRPVQVIRILQLRNLPVADLPQLLSMLPGVDVRQRGAGDVQSDLSIRGGSFEQTLILLNGIRMNDPQTGHHNLNLPIDLEQADRIELLNGPGSRIYGTNASAGAINIVTNTADENMLRIHLMAGDFSLFSGTVSGNLRTGKARHFLSSAAKSCGGYTNNTDYTEAKAYYHGVFPIAHHRLEVQAGWMNKGFGANSFYSARYPDQYEQTRSKFIALRGLFGQKWQWHPALYWKRHHDRFELFRNEAPAWYASHNFHRTDVAGAELNVNHSSKLGKTSMGIDFRYEHIYSNVLGEIMGDTLQAGGETDGYFTRSAARQLLSIFLDHQYSYKRFAVAAGVLMHYAGGYGTGWYPGIDCSYGILKHTRLYVSGNRSLRLPTFTDLYYKGPMNAGNPDLKPEESWDVEGGLRYETPAIRGHFAAFMRWGEHIIDWVKLPDETVWHTENLTRLNTAGFEVNLQCDLPMLTKEKFFIKQLSISYQYIGMNKPETGYISYYVMDYLKHKAVFTMNHRIWKKISAGWVLAVYDRNGSYTDAVSMQETDYAPYLLMHGKISWNPGPVGLYISLNNIGNTQYRDFSSVEMPGRWVMCGLQLVIK